MRGPGDRAGRFARDRQERVPGLAPTWERSRVPGSNALNSDETGDSGGNDEEEGTEYASEHSATFQAAVRMNVKELFLC